MEYNGSFYFSIKFMETIISSNYMMNSDGNN